MRVKKKLPCQGQGRGRGGDGGDDVHAAVAARQSSGSTRKTRRRSSDRGRRYGVGRFGPGASLGGTGVFAAGTTSAL